MPVYILLFTDPVIDVDVQSTTTHTYTADTDSKQLVYRCVSDGSSDGLVWRYNNVDYNNSLNAYQFYKVVLGTGMYRIECYSGTNKILGNMELTLKGEILYIYIVTKVQPRLSELIGSE